MLFNSAVFLFVFLPVTYVVFWSLRTKNTRYIWLTITGYVFYGYWDARFCLLMLFSTLVSYAAGLGFLHAHTPQRRKLLLIAPITVDLLLLGFFKYADFAIHSVNWAAEWFSGRPPLTPLNVLLPVGISFYTFHTITYIVDSYRGVIRPTRNFWEFACYVSLFSQLVAGPIVRFRELQDDLENVMQKERSSGLNIGWSFFIIGLCQKVLIADTIASVIDPALRDVNSLSTLSAWLCAFGYAYQLYFDFAGYSNMAVGLGHMFGMNIPRNFAAPYQALNPSDFWQRWHISLSRCLRDYLYIPLGGNRGTEAETYRNLMLTMLLGGLWHGAAWTFVIWGAYHGLLLSLYRAYGALWDRLPHALQRAGMFLLVVLGWIVFRSSTWSDAATWLARMFVPSEGVLVIGAGVLLVFVIMAAAWAHKLPEAFDWQHRWNPAMTAALAVLLVLSLIRIHGAENSPFLYFQF